MIVCDDVEFIEWRPDFSSAGVPPPECWTRLLFKGVELCNAMEWVQWLEDPTQVLLCEACGTPGCRAAGYVHVSGLGDCVLWTGVTDEEIHPWHELGYRHHGAFERFGALLIPAAAWDRWRARFPSLPSVADLRKPCRSELGEAWRYEVPRAFEASSLDRVLSLVRDRAVAGDSLVIEEALRIIGDLASWLQRAPQEPVDGAIAPAAEAGAQVERLWFDGLKGLGWPAFARAGGRFTFAFGQDRVFLPPPPLAE